MTKQYYFGSEELVPLGEVVKCFSLTWEVLDFFEVKVHALPTTDGGQVLCITKSDMTYLTNKLNIT